MRETLKKLTEEIKRLKQEEKAIYERLEEIEDKIAKELYGEKLTSILDMSKVDTVLEKARENNEYAYLCRKAEMLIEAKRKLLKELIKHLLEHPSLPSALRGDLVKILNGKGPVPPSYEDVILHISSNLLHGGCRLKI